MQKSGNNAYLEAVPEAIAAEFTWGVLQMCIGGHIDKNSICEKDQ
jgi:hypothetical protein